MKRLMLFLAAVLACAMLTGAAAELFYVKQDLEAPLSLRDEFTNEVLTVIPQGACLDPDQDKSTDLFAWVSWDGLSGYVIWNGLTRVPPETATVPDPVPADPTEEPVTESYTLTAVNAVIQAAGTKNRATGESFTEMIVRPEDNVVFTATVPKGKSVDYWVLNGVRYDFLAVVKTIRMTGFDRSWTVEAVLRKSEAETLHPEGERAEPSDEERMVLRVNGGAFCHLKSGTTGGGGWIDSFDFTYDYENRATGAEETGGRISFKIRADVPKGRKILGWRFDGTEVYPGVAVRTFAVRGLDTAMTFEPILNQVEAVAEPAPDEPAPTPVPLVTVTCKGCTFSGGGYEDVTVGQVPPGTEITVRSIYNVQTWSVNDAIVVNGDGTWFDGLSFTRTVSADTTFVCVHKLK